MPPGVSQPPNVHETLQKAVEELSKAIRNKDAKRAARESESLSELADQVLSEVLLSIAYAADVGDPEGTVLLADDVSHRHDFGFGAKDAELRLRQAWSMPRQDVTPGIPWHVSGSLLGLDVALAPLALRRLNFERVLEAPKLTSNRARHLRAQRLASQPLRLARRRSRSDRRSDRPRHAPRRGIAPAAPAPGRAWPTRSSMEPWRRRAMPGRFAHERDRVTSMLSLTELLVLGGGRAGGFRRVGHGGGRHRLRLPAPAAAGQLAVPDRASATRADRGRRGRSQSPRRGHAERDAAARRARPSVLSGAMQDFIDEVRPTDDGDWLTLVRGAAAGAARSRRGLHCRRHGDRAAGAGQ